MSDDKSTITDIVPHAVNLDWPEGSVFFFLNPASGAVEVRPAYRDKIARSLTRHARKMNRRLLILHLRLQIEYFALQARCAALGMSRDILRFVKKVCSCHRF